MPMEGFFCLLMIFCKLNLPRVSHSRVCPKALDGAGEKTGNKTSMGPLQDLVTRYGINYTGMQMTQWDFQNKGTRTSPARLSFVLKVPLRHLHPSVIYSVPYDWILQRAYWAYTNKTILKKQPHKQLY